MRVLEDFRSCDRYAASPACDVEGLIEDYASGVVEATLANSAMANRLRMEIVDHLTEAMDDMDASNGAKADLHQRARAAITAFGPQELIAGEYSQVVAESRWRHLRWTVVTGIGLTFLVMRMRSYILGPDWREELMQSAWGVGMMYVDRYAFLIAILLVLVGLVLDRMHHMPGISAPRMSCQTVKRVLCTATIPAIMVLMTALAGIGALLSSMISQGSLKGQGLEWLTIAALALFCSVLMRNVVVLMRSCRPILQG